MSGDRLDRLATLLGAIADADRLRLAALASEAAACKSAAAGYLARARAAASPLDAGPGDLAALARWRGRLASRARAADERAAALGAEIQAQSERFTRSKGRARAAADLVASAESDRRRRAERRAEDMPPAPVSGQSSDPLSRSGWAFAESGSPAMT